MASLQHIAPIFPTADMDAMRAHYEALGFEKTKLYRGADIQNLSASSTPSYFPGVRLNNPFIKLSQKYDSGSIKFTYGARTIYAAGGLDEAEGGSLWTV